LLVFEAEIERGNRPSQGKNRTEDRRGGETCGILIRVNNYWGFGVVREAWRRSDTHTEIGKHGGCGLFLYSRRRQKEGAEGRETNTGKGGGVGVAGRSGQGRTSQHPTQDPKQDPSCMRNVKKEAYRAGVVLILCFAVLYSLFCVATSIYAATSGYLHRVPGRSEGLQLRFE
jgi:hypothetical protein